MNKIISFRILFPIVSVLTFVIIAIRSAIVPMAHDEVATFFYYIQQGRYMPFKAHVDANNHVLNSFLGWISSELYGDSMFAMRIPNLLSFLLLILAVWRISKRLEKESAKLVLLAGFLISFNWIEFFGICRGYGMSMGLFVLAMTFVLDLLLTERKYTSLVYAYLFFQLAICANLIFIVPVIIITGLISLKQLYYKEFFKWKNLLILTLHSITMLFWLYFSFFLKDSGALYLGEGHNYWQITFTTLITLLVGKHSVYIEIVVLASFIAILVSLVYLLNKTFKKEGLSYAVSGGVFSIVMLVLLIVCFYMMKLLLGVNYPEDRAGLVFYIFYILSLVFVVELLSDKMSRYLSLLILALFTVHFAFSLNFNTHSLYSYASFSDRFYERLLEEQKKVTDRQITIGGSKGRELIWAYNNYRHDGALNPMEFVKFMNLNADYCIGHKRERKYYAAYYDEIDYDDAGGYALLKRKEPIKRNFLRTLPDANVEMTAERPFVDYWSVRDTTFSNRNPLEITFDLTFTKAPNPSYAWMVLQIDSSETVKYQYKRIPFDWVRGNWVANPPKTYHLTLTTDKLPEKVHRITFHTWNCAGQDLNFKISNIKMYRLEGKGVDIEIPRLREEED